MNGTDQNYEANREPPGVGTRPPPVPVDVVGAPATAHPHSTPMTDDFSPTIGKIAEAMAAAQGAYSPAVKDSTNPHFNSKYSSLAACFAACRPALSKHGVCFTQIPIRLGNGLGLRTIFLHKGSGEWIAGSLQVLPRDQSPQSVASAFTYAKRTAFIAMAGVAPEDDDDDGESAEGRQHSGGGRDSRHTEHERRETRTARQDGPEDRAPSEETQAQRPRAAKKAESTRKTEPQRSGELIAVLDSVAKASADELSSIATKARESLAGDERSEVLGAIYMRYFAVATTPDGMKAPQANIIKDRDAKFLLEKDLAKVRAYFDQRMVEISNPSGPREAAA